MLYVHYFSCPFTTTRLLVIERNTRTAEAYETVSRLQYRCSCHTAVLPGVVRPPQCLALHSRNPIRFSRLLKLRMKLNELYYMHTDSDEFRKPSFLPFVASTLPRLSFHFSSWEMRAQGRVGCEERTAECLNPSRAWSSKPRGGSALGLERPSAASGGEGAPLRAQGGRRRRFHH